MKRYLDYKEIINLEHAVSVFKQRSVSPVCLNQDVIDKPGNSTVPPIYPSTKLMDSAIEALNGYPEEASPGGKYQCSYMGELNAYIMLNPDDLHDHEVLLHDLKHCVEVMEQRIKAIKGDDYEEMGKVVLNVDGRKTTWYYVADAIKNGLLEETLDLEDEHIEELFASHQDDIYDIDSLGEVIPLEFDQVLLDLFNRIINGTHASEQVPDLPNFISITGDEEDGEQDVMYIYQNVK